MCGRYKLTVPYREIVRLYNLTNSVNLPARWNIAPTQDVLAILSDPATKRRRGAMLRWGLLPSWAKDKKLAYSLINARAETVASKPAFRDAFKKRRCIIPADGFYEWQATGSAHSSSSLSPNGGEGRVRGRAGATRREGEGRNIGGTRKQPWCIVMKDRAVFGFAGLWEEWTDNESGEIVRSCTIIVTMANALLAPIHDRMPVILDPADWATWLGEEPASPDALQALLKPYPANRMECFKIGTRIGNVKYDEPGLVEPV